MGTFEPDAAESPHPGSGRVFKILSRIVLKVLDGFQCESRKTAFNLGSDIRIIFRMRYLHPDLTQINVKKLKFIHKLTSSDTSKTAKITKR